MPQPHFQPLALQVPALLEAQVLSARALFLNGNLDAAVRQAHEILRSNKEEVSMHLLVCR